MDKEKRITADIRNHTCRLKSPLLSNIMLNELDKELEARGLNFVRYADDCVITVRSSAAANRVMHTITRWIEKKLGLKVNMTKTKVTKPGKILER